MGVCPTLYALCSRVVVYCVVQVLALSIVHVGEGRYRGGTRCRYCCYSGPSLRGLFPSFPVFFLRRVGFCVYYVCFRVTLWRVLLPRGDVVRLFILFYPSGGGCFR